MMRDYNNVYGHLLAPMGLSLVLQAAQRIVGEGNAFIYKSQFNGAETLHLTTDRVDVESTPLEDDTRHLLNGGVGGSLQEVVAFVRALSEVLNEAGIEHRFEVYGENHDLVQLVPHEPR